MPEADDSRHEMAEPAKEGSFTAWRPLVWLSVLAILIMVGLAIAYLVY